MHALTSFTKHQYGTTTHDGFDTKHSLFYKMSTMLKINFARTGLDTFCGCSNFFAHLRSRTVLKQICMKVNINYYECQSFFMIAS